MFHHNNKRTYTRISHLSRVGTVLAVSAFVVASGVQLIEPTTAAARDYNAEIKNLQNQIADYNKRSSELSAQSDTLQSKIAELQNQQATIQKQIDLSAAEKAQLEQQIADSEAKIKEQTKNLSESLKAQYYNDQTTSLDVLMNSNSVSDYVDRQARQSVVSSEIKKSVNRVKSMKADLELKKARVEVVISQQSEQKRELADSQAEQQKLLDDTQGQEAKYQELTAQSNVKIAQLQAEQAALNRKFYHGTGVACGGGYPAYLCNASKDAMVDPWGMFNRECVSYAAYKVASTYGWPSYWPRGGNNAKNWLGKAQNLGIPTGRTPKVGSVAVSTSGEYGHVAWVEAVNGNKITISQYNADMKGTYSVEPNVDASDFNGYIYFDQMP